jgi:hypothetical protein
MSMRSRNFRWRPGRSPREAWDAGRYIVVLDQRVEGVLMRWWPQIEIQMKTEASWEDHTSNARQTLAALPVKIDGAMQATGNGWQGQTSEIYAPLGPDGRGWALILRQWMTYGKALELHHQGRYAIVGPTLEQVQRAVWADIKRAARLR